MWPYSVWLVALHGRIEGPEARRSRGCITKTKATLHVASVHRAALPHGGVLDPAYVNRSGPSKRCHVGYSTARRLDAILAVPCRCYSPAPKGQGRFLGEDFSLCCVSRVGCCFVAPAAPFGHYTKGAGIAEAEAHVPSAALVDHV